MDQMFCRPEGGDAPRLLGFASEHNFSPEPEMVGQWSFEKLLSVDNRRAQNCYLQCFGGE